MTSYFYKPTHWLMRAEMTRTIADGMDSAEAKDILQRIAQDYERMARRMENEAKQQSRLVRQGPPPPRSDDMDARLAALQRKFQRVGR